MEKIKDLDSKGKEITEDSDYQKMRETIGKNICLMRKLLSINKTELENKINITRQSLIKMENGKGNFSISSLYSLAKFFGVPPILFFLTSEFIYTLLEIIKLKEYENYQGINMDVRSTLSSAYRHSGDKHDWYVEMAKNQINRLKEFEGCQNDSMNIMVCAIIGANIYSVESAQLGFNLGKKIGNMKRPIIND